MRLRKFRVTASRRIASFEFLEDRVLLSSAFNITNLTALRNDPTFSSITGQGVGIAVLDTGVYAKNADLSANVVAFYNAVEDPVDTTTLSVADASDNVGHGTHVSGIAASSNPSIGVATGAKLIDIKVLADSNESQLGGDPVLRGLEWVANNYLTYNIRVVNMSLGESGVNENTVTTADAQDAEAVEIKSLQKLGITVVSASGNSYANDPTPGESFPAIVSTIGVANTWDNTGQASDFGVPFGESGDQYYAVDNSASADTLASTSQRSTVNNQLAAPGEDIYSTWNGTLDSSNGSDLLHNTLSGTSMAAPFVSGVVALMQNAAKYFGGHYLSDPNQILQILQQTADTIVDSNNPNNARYDSETGVTSNLPETGLTFKRVDVLKAIEEVESIVTGGSITTGPKPGPDTDNTVANATPVNSIDGTTVYTFDGSIGTDGLVQVGANDIDLYKLDVISPGAVTIALSQSTGGTAFSGALRLFDSSGNVVAHIDGTATAYPTLTTAKALPVGTYYLGISSAGNESYALGATGTGGSSQGDYVLQISLSNPDPNGTIQGAVAVDLTVPNESLQDPNTGATYTDLLEPGELGSDPPPAGGSARITVPSDVDMFQLTAPDDGTLTLDTISNTFSGDQTLVEVFDANQKVLGSSSNTSAFTGENVLSVNLSKGQTYYVAVTVPQNAGFNPTDPYQGRAADATPGQAYDLHLRFDNGDLNGTALSADTAMIGSTISANVGADNGNTVGSSGSKDVDWYNFTAGADGLFDVTAQSGTSGFTPVITLWAYTQGQSNIVKVADTSSSTLFASPAGVFSPAAVTPPGGSGSAHLIYQVAAGDSFFVAITGQGNSSFNWYAVASGTGGQTGNYTLITKLQPLASLTTLSDNAVGAGTPQTITIGDTIQGNIGSDGALVIGPTDVDIYKLVAPATETIDVRTFTGQEGNADTVLRVFDSSGNQLTANDNISSSSTDSEVKLSVQKGQTYYIGVDGAGPDAMAYNPLTGTGAGSGSTGTYGLSVTATAPGFSVSAPAAVVAYPGASLVFTVTLDQALSTTATVDYATSDGTALAGTDYTAEQGTLTFAPGVTTQTVTVPVMVNSSDTTNGSTFTLTLSNPTGAQIASATATGTITDEAVTTRTFSAGKPITYTDSTGKKVQLVLTGPGTGTALFANNIADPSQIALNNTTGSSTFTIKTPSTTLNDIVVNGSLLALNGKTLTLTGSLNVTGSVQKLTLGNVNGGSTGSAISVGAAAGPMSVTLGSVSNESFTTVGAIGLLKVNDWLNSGGGTVMLSAASIGGITSKGEFDASITAGSLGTVKIGGSITGGAWAISGNGANLTVNGTIDPAWTANFNGSLGSVHFTNDSGNLTAGSIANLKVTGNLSSASITLTSTGAALGNLSVGRTVSGSQIRSAGSVGAVSVGAFLDSTLFAGVDPSVTALPTTETDFTAADNILSFSVKGNIAADSFSNSYIAAKTIGKVSLARVNSSNGGVPFGIATTSLGSFSNRGVLKWTSKESVSLLVPDGDLVESVLTS